MLSSRLRGVVQNRQKSSSSKIASASDRLRPVAAPWVLSTKGVSMVKNEAQNTTAEAPIECVRIASAESKQP